MWYAVTDKYTCLCTKIVRGAFIEYGMARNIVVQSKSFAYKGNT